jgi:hypothetical protein
MRRTGINQFYSCGLTSKELYIKEGGFSSTNVSPDNKLSGEIVAEVRGFKLVCAGNYELSAADRLNGMEWRGGVSLYGDASRGCIDGGPWSKWPVSNPIFQFSCMKVGGKWQISDTHFDRDAPLSPDEFAALPITFIPRAE